MVPPVSVLLFCGVQGTPCTSVHGPARAYHCCKPSGIGDVCRRFLAYGFHDQALSFPVRGALLLLSLPVWGHVGRETAARESHSQCHQLQALASQRHKFILVICSCTPASVSMFLTIACDHIVVLRACSHDAHQPAKHSAGASSCRW